MKFLRYVKDHSVISILLVLIFLILFSFFLSREKTVSESHASNSQVLLSTVAYGGSLTTTPFILQFLPGRRILFTVECYDGRPKEAFCADVGRMEIATGQNQEWPVVLHLAPGTGAILSGTVIILYTK